MDAYMSQPHNVVGPSLPNAQFSQQHGSFKQQKDGEISLMLNGNFNQQNGSSQMYSPVFNNSNCGFSTQNGDFAEDSIRKFSDLSHTEGHISYPNFLANEGCINRRDGFKPQFNQCKAAKQAYSKVLGKLNHMTSNIQILQNVSEVSEMAGSTVSTATKNTEKNIHVGVRPKALSATICTQQEPPAIATQANVKASHSHVFKALPVTHALPLSVPTYPHLQQSLVKGIEAFSIPNSSTPDKDMVNCKQASHPMKLWRSLFLIPPG
uniref:uncharacterized protein LOC105352110 n=1 Tax=Fragaria vesca subsp. vesca TaxID=101020 RepID=UPI0005C7E91F|nr:PREDICTED: uncharacterized protein LOC105352110 [Fragaria vesca subsp. vesca]